MSLLELICLICWEAGQSDSSLVFPKFIADALSFESLTQLTARNISHMDAQHAHTYTRECEIKIVPFFLLDVRCWWSLIVLHFAPFSHSFSKSLPITKILMTVNSTSLAKISINIHWIKRMNELQSLLSQESNIRYLEFDFDVSQQLKYHMSQQSSFFLSGSSFSASVSDLHKTRNDLS